MITDQHFFPSREGLSTMMTELAGCVPARRLTCLTGLQSARWPVARRRGRDLLVTSLFNPGGKWTKTLELARVALSLKFRLDPDVIIADSCWSGNITSLLARLLRIPVVMLAHGNELLQLRDKSWPKQYLSLKTADRIVAVSDYTKNLLLGLGIPEERVEVIHPGSDPDIFYPLPADEVEKVKTRFRLSNKKILLTAGGLVSRKGQDMVIKALPTVLKEFPDVVYLMLGEGEDEKYFRNLATSLGVEENVRFFGVVRDWNRLRELYNACDIYIMASRLQVSEGSVENFGIAFVEANACGKPAIGGRSGGIPEAIIEGETGLLVDPENDEEIAGAIIRLLRNPNFAAELGRKGRLRVENELNWNQVGRIMGQICLKAARKRK